MKFPGGGRPYTGFMAYARPGDASSPVAPAALLGAAMGMALALATLAPLSRTLAASADGQGSALSSASYSRVLTGTGAGVGGMTGSTLQGRTLLASGDATGTATGIATRSTSFSGASMGTGDAAATYLLKRLIAGSGDGVGDATATALFVTYDTDSMAYFAAMTVQPDTARKNLIDTFIRGLKTDAVWAKLDWVTLLASHDAQAARINAKQPSKLLVASGTTTFTVDRGYAGNGSTGTLTTNEIVTTGPNYAQNSASFGTWCNVQGGTGPTPHFGSSLSTPTTSITAINSGSEAYMINGTTNTASRTSSSRLGHRAAVRTGSTAHQGYFNGAATTAGTVASVAPAAGNLGYLLRSNTVFSPDRLAAFYLGGALTATDASNIHTRLNTFLTAIGAA